MKNYFIFLLVGAFVISSCSTGNMASRNFSKRKYTKGTYKPEKNDYSVAKSNKNTDETKYVSKTEKNKLKQNYKTKTTPSKNKTKTTKPSLTKEEVAEYSNEVKEVVLAENKANQNILLEDHLIENEEKEERIKPQKETAEVSPATPKDDKALAAEILGYIGFGLGLFSVILGAIGFLYSFAYLALVAGILGLGSSIASWIMGGKTDWNFWGLIASCVGIALGVIFSALILGGVL